jgi:predicted NUDIX family NTP pyrophosphohydrolase
MILGFQDFLVEKKIDKLSGVVLILDNRILLVNPKKFKDKKRKWSVPKGHVEKDLSNLENALKELREESGIKLNPGKAKKNKIKEKTITYKKSAKKKELHCYVIKLKKKDLPVDVKNNFQIARKFFRRSEISQAGFFTKQQAENRIEEAQKELLKYLKDGN